MHSDWIVVGRFGRVHGIKGVISIISFTEPRENILDYSQWYIKKSGQWQAINRFNDEITQKHILTQVEGYVIREDVASLTNFEIAVRRDTLPLLALDEYYWHELIGMTVIHINGSVFGQVHEVMSTGSNDVFIVEGERRYLIPYIIDDVVVSISKEKRQITVNWDLDF